MVDKPDGMYDIHISKLVRNASCPIHDDAEQESTSDNFWTIIIVHSFYLIVNNVVFADSGVGELHREVREVENFLESLICYPTVY